MPRLRMIAGPNGSGKSTLIDALAEKFDLGHCLNPDLIDKELREKGMLDLAPWGIAPHEDQLRRFVGEHGLGNTELAGKVSAQGQKLIVPREAAGGYLAAILCDFMRRQWLAEGSSFTFETVMSSRDKVGLLAEARAAGYRTYLYYICTDSVLINQERVAARVALGGHNVPADKILNRYDRSLSLLKEAITLANRAYLFDNSAKAYRLVAEFEENKYVRIAESPPGWFIASVLNKA
jgi:predicted ABC-type ATPase